MLKISIIAAMGKNREIGLGDSLPWDLKEDLKYFREKTINKPVIMGQKTFQSLGKALPNRINIVLSDNLDTPGCLIANSIEDALKKAGDAQEVMIIGGASVYQQFLPLAHRMYLTLIDKDFQADVFFPEFDSSQWVEVEREDQESIQYKYSFVVLDKKVIN
jgi:dihydrofolate reductase